MSVVINRYPEQTVPLYNSEEQLIGYVNYNEFNDVRVQIYNQHLEGYYVVYNGIKLPIDSKGRLEDWPDGLFDQLEKHLSQLLG